MIRQASFISARGQYRNFWRKRWSFPGLALAELLYCVLILRKKWNWERDRDEMNISLCWISGGNFFLKWNFFVTFLNNLIKNVIHLSHKRNFTEFKLNIRANNKKEAFGNLSKSQFHSWACKNFAHSVVVSQINDILAQIELSLFMASSFTCI